jgi:hypothetical protein
MKKCLSVALLLAFLCSGCQEQAPPPPPTPAPAPEKTPEKIKEEIMATLAPMQSVIAEPAAGGFTDDTKKSVIEGLQKARSANQASENGKQALAMVAHEIETIISKARDLKRWRLVLGAIEAYEVMSPGTTKMNRLKERGKLYVSRPTVRVKGFMDDKETKDTYVFLEVTLHPSEEVNSIQVRIGEEFFGVRLLDIVGNKKGVQLEYLAIPGDTWDVMTGR